VVESGTEDPVNLCTGVGMSMTELAQLACAHAGYQPEFEFRLDKPAGVAYRVGDPQRFHQYYEPQVSLAEGVARAFKG
jgi:nucleoside-diphosphate-sugar epimerase